MDDISQTLATAFQLHQAGKLSEAERLYREVLTHQPAHHAALDLLGVAIFQQGRPAEAVELISRAVHAMPNNALYLTHLGTAHAALKQWEQAANILRRAVTANPNSADAHYNLGTVEYGLGQLDRAAASFERAVAIDPARADAHYNLGNTWSERGRFDIAEQCYREAIRYRPGFADAHSNLGAALQKTGRFDEALACFEQALRLNPQLVDALNNRGAILQAIGRFDEALRHLDAAIRLKPDYAEAHHNRAFVLLSRGDFAAGWPAYEWRRKRKGFRGSTFGEPLWDGSDLADRTLLVHTEQGIGDTLQFIRYIPLVRQRCDHVLVQVPGILLPLLTASGYENLIAGGSDLPNFDVHAPLLSLPGIFGTTLETIPNPGPYLAADPQLIQAWRRRLDAFEGFRIGIAWQGNPNYLLDRFRSIPLTAFGRLAQVPGVRLVNLQQGLGTEQIAAAAEQVPLVDLGPEVDRDAGAFMDTAAVMKNLDLVIAADTATAHLAAALGVPTWVAVCCYPEWRWMTDRDDSPWYPTMRLFRQEKPREWNDVFSRMAATLVPLAERAR